MKKPTLEGDLGLLPLLLEEEAFAGGGDGEAGGDGEERVDPVGEVGAD